jgi:hypothetical protein
MTTEAPLLQDRLHVAGVGGGWGVAAGGGRMAADRYRRRCGRGR